MDFDDLQNLPLNQSHWSLFVGGLAGVKIVNWVDL